MEQYVGLDVSLKETSLCVVDQTGTTLWQGKCASTPECIAAVLARRAPGATRIGLESAAVDLDGCSHAAPNFRYGRG
jgi:transposase